MDYIFHEKQEGSLCAQHCLNSLLQGEYFSAIDLAEIASEIDKQELNFLYGAGKATEDYEKYLQQPSANYDDSGFFSIQVLQKALASFNLELIPYQSQNEISLAAQRDPTTQKAYICNFKEHWYTIRKFSDLYWFNLNSLFKKPQYISDTYLSVLLAQLRADGYSIFIVNGDLQVSPADQHLVNVPKSVIISRYSGGGGGSAGGATSSRAQNYNEFDDDDMRAAIEASLKHDENEINRDYSYQNAVQSSQNEFIQQEDNDLELAIQLSLQNNENINNFVKNDEIVEKNLELDKNESKENKNEVADLDEIRRKRLKFLENIQKPKD